MNEIKFSEMSNAEINILLKSYTDEYETVKNRIQSELDRLKELDKLYNKGLIELHKRKAI